MTRASRMVVLIGCLAFGGTLSLLRAQRTPLSGEVFVQDNGSKLRFGPSTFSVQNANGELIDDGRFTINGDTLTLTVKVRSGHRYTENNSSLRIEGNKLYADNGLVWVRFAARQPAPLKLPSTYVSSQTPANKLQLNADNSFLLQEGGQTYHGAFDPKGRTLELYTSETHAETTLSIQGNSLIDSNLQTWNLREQSAGTVPGEDAIRNDDIVKMVKAGFDDAIIIAKISSSKCQFDTSTDALIQLKQRGVSAAVLKTMVSTAK